MALCPAIKIIDSTAWLKPDIKPSLRAESCITPVKYSPEKMNETRVNQNSLVL